MRTPPLATVYGGDKRGSMFILLSGTVTVAETASANALAQAANMAALSPRSLATPRPGTATTGPGSPRPSRIGGATSPRSTTYGAFGATTTTIERTLRAGDVIGAPPALDNPRQWSDVLEGNTESGSTGVIAADATVITASRLVQALEVPVRTVVAYLTRGVAPWRPRGDAKQAAAALPMASACRVALETAYVV